MYTAHVIICISVKTKYVRYGKIVTDYFIFVISTVLLVCESTLLEEGAGEEQYAFAVNSSFK